MFSEGFCLVSEAGNHLVVQKLLGRGGRRDVYEVLISETGERKALRWFREGYGNFDHKVHENLAFLSRIGCPDKSILWVEDVVSTGDAGFGYVTRLIPNGFVPFHKLVRERELSEVSKCNFALDYLRALHNANTQGLLLFTADGEANCYVHAQTGHLLIDECERTTIRGATLYPMMYVHWTSLGAFHGANAILEAMGLAPLDLAAYPLRTLSDSFYGTNFSAACAWWTAPDTITAYVPEEGKSVTSNFTGREEPGRLYAEEYLQKKNKYACFLGGNQPLCVIRSQNPGGSLLVIRDSYADCLAPFLSERFSQVHLFDLRYNRMDIHDYIESNGIDAVLVLYSFPNFAEDENLFLLSR